METDVDPALHWVTARDYAQGGNGEASSEPRLISAQVARSRARLAGDPYVTIHEAGEPPMIGELRALHLAAVLEECAARLRLAVQDGSPAGSAEVADLADDLARDLYRRTILLD